MFYAFSVYQQLPQDLAIHVTTGNRANGFADKMLFLLGAPLLMSLLQVFFYLLTSLSLPEPQSKSKWLHYSGRVTNRPFGLFLRWLIPVVFALLYLLTIRYNLSADVNIGRVSLCICAVLLMIIGNYLPKKVTEHSQPASRSSAYLVVGSGLLLFAAALFV